MKKKTISLFIFFFFLIFFIPHFICQPDKIIAATRPLNKEGECDPPFVKICQPGKETPETGCLAYYCMHKGQLECMAKEGVWDDVNATCTYTESQNCQGDNPDNFECPEGYSPNIKETSSFGVTTYTCVCTKTSVEEYEKTETAITLLNPEDALKNKGTEEECFQTALGCIPTKPQKFVEVFLNWAIGLAGGIAFLFMIFGAFQILTSAGDPEKVKNGQEILTSAVIGLLFVIFSTFLLRIIGIPIMNIGNTPPSS